MCWEAAPPKKLLLLFVFLISLLLVPETLVERRVKIRSVINDILLLLFLFLLLIFLFLFFVVVDPRNLHLKFGWNWVSNS